MKMKLELVPMPVTDIDRAKAFYTEKVGFVEDVDVRPAEGVRIVQLTPPGAPATPSEIVKHLDPRSWPSPT